MIRRNKYGNEPVTVDGQKYRSKREQRCHADLLLLEKAKKIVDLRREVPFELARKISIRGEDRARPPVRYVADFVFTDRRTGETVVWDAKGRATPVYRLKKHLMATVHGIHVVEV